MMYYQIIRADGSFKNYKIFNEMLDDFDRRDMGDLKTLFEPCEEDEVWRNQQGYNLISWRLFDSCGVHVLLMDNGIAIHMMIEKKYPLTHEMLSRMINKRLEVDHESEMAFELLIFTRLKLKKQKSVWKHPLSIDDLIGRNLMINKMNIKFRGGLPFFFGFPPVKLSVAGRGGPGKGGSCVLIPDLVVMAKVGASGSGILLLLIVESSGRIVHAIAYGVVQAYLLSLLCCIASEMEEMFMGGDTSSHISSWYWTYSSIRFHPSSSVRESK
ncbi:hypothetical protein Tco_0665853 [Tanacetum coccineum]